MVECHPGHTLYVYRYIFTIYRVILCNRLDLLWIWNVPLSVSGILVWKCKLNSQQNTCWPDCKQGEPILVLICWQSLCIIVTNIVRKADIRYWRSDSPVYNIGLFFIICNNSCHFSNCHLAQSRRQRMLLRQDLGWQIFGAHHAKISESAYDG